MKKLVFLFALLFTVYVRAQEFREIEYLDSYSKKISSLFSNNSQSVHVSLVKEFLYFSEDTVEEHYVVLDIFNSSSEIIGTSNSFSMGSVGQIWGSSWNSGVLTSINKRSGHRVFYPEDLKDLMGNTTKVLMFVNANSNSQTVKGFNIIFDSAMSLGVVVEPKNIQLVNQENISWVLFIDDTEFNVDYQGGMKLLKKLAYYGEYIQNNDSTILQMIKKI